MAVTTGLRKTVLGDLPSTWKVTTLGDCVRRDSPICYGILMPGAHFNGGVPIVKVRDIADGKISEADILRAHPAIDQAYSRSRLATGDLLITIRGTTGRVGLVPRSLDGANITQDTARLRIDIESSSAYVYYALQSDALKNQIALRTVGQAVRGINIRDVKALAIAIPDVAEQRAIAEALSDVDALMAGLDRLIAKKRDIKKAAMQQLLTGKARLPGFHGDWRSRPLGELAAVSKGTQVRSSDLNDAGQFAHLNGGTTPSGFTSKANTKAHTIAISEGGNSCGYVQFMERPYWCGGHCYSVIPNSVDNRFLYQALKAQQPAIMALRVGSGLPNVQKTALKAFKVRFPLSPDEQIAIATVLSEMDAELAALEARRNKTRALKQGMMQELLTGRTRLV